jgi:urea transporter
MDLLKVFLRGIGQVMLQNNALTGLMFLAGIFYHSWLFGLTAILGAAVSLLTAIILKYDKKEIHDGLYGFNGALVGLALPFLFGENWQLFLSIVVGAVATTLIMKFMLKKKLPAYTFPFVLTTWILFYLITAFNLSPIILREQVLASQPDFVSAGSMGFSQVMFQANIVTGIIFFLAILVNSRRVAVYALGGSLIGALVAFAFSLPLGMLNYGLFGYNGVLCGIAFADKKRLSWLFALISIILSVVLLNWMPYPALTAPFVFATWLTLGVKRIIAHE